MLKKEMLNDEKIALMIYNRSVHNVTIEIDLLPISHENF
jgi:hypothetical protein